MVTVLEAKEAFPDGPVDILVDEGRLLGSDDVDAIAEQLEPDSSAAILLFEHLWAVTFTQALRDAGGELIVQERIPAAAVEEVERATPRLTDEPSPDVEPAGAQTSRRKEDIER